MSTHTAIATIAKSEVGTIQVPTEEPGEDEVKIKVEYAAMVPPDVYMVDRGFLIKEYPTILGITTAGTVSSAGRNVKDLKPGDRVTAFAYGPSRNKGIQEYAIQPRSVCAKIPDTLSLEDAATIPDNFVCAFYTLFDQLSLPIPSTIPALEDPPATNVPILIYGAGSTAGQYMIQLLSLARYKRIFATASARHHDYLRSLGATEVFDYNSPTLADDIINVAGPGKVTLAVDCIAAQSTMGALAKVINPTGSVALLMPVKEGVTVNNSLEDKFYSLLPIPDHLNPFSEGTDLIGVRTFYYQENRMLKEKLMPLILPGLLGQRLIQPSRFRLMEKGSLQQRVEEALDLFRKNQVSGEKLVIKIN